MHQCRSSSDRRDKCHGNEEIRRDSAILKAGSTVRNRVSVISAVRRYEIRTERPIPGQPVLTGRFARCSTVICAILQGRRGETLFGNRNKTGTVKLFVANLCEKSLLPVMIAAKFLIKSPNPWRIGMLPAGKSLRTLREKLGLTMRDIEVSSTRVAEKYRNEEFAIPPSRLSDIETKGGFAQYFSFIHPSRDLSPGFA